MPSEIRIYDSSNNLKKVISKETASKMLFSDCADLQKDVNLKPSFFRPGKVKVRRKPRYLKCVECGGYIETVARRKVVYCEKYCGELYRKKKALTGEWHRGIVIEEVPWDGGDAPKFKRTKYQ